MRQILIAGTSGILFGMGLYISQMTDPMKVIAFLDLSRLAKGTWDPSLIFVMAAGFLVMALAHAYRKTRENKGLGAWVLPTFDLPSTKEITRPLVLGSATFGVGWGLAGYCPGPAIASLAFLPTASFFFVVSMTVGSAAAFWIQNRKLS